MLSARADPANSHLWSEYARASGATLATRPTSPPTTCIGSFEVFNYPTNRAVVVYWQQLEEKYHSGPNFRYQIVQVLEDERRVKRVASEVTDSYAKFNILPSHHGYTFHVNSVNDEGAAAGSSSVFVPSKQEISDLIPRAVTVIYSNDDPETIKISWFKPSSSSNSAVVRNYTIFWCQKQRVVQRRCDGRLEFAVVDPQSRSSSSDVVMFLDDSNHDTLLYQLSLPADVSYSFSVSGNSESGSSSGKI